MSIVSVTIQVFIDDDRKCTRSFWGELFDVVGNETRTAIRQGPRTVAPFSDKLVKSVIKFSETVIPVWEKWYDPIGNAKNLVTYMGRTASRQYNHRWSCDKCKCLSEDCILCRHVRLWSFQVTFDGWNWIMQNLLRWQMFAERVSMHAFENMTKRSVWA